MCCFKSNKKNENTQCESRPRYIQVRRPQRNAILHTCNRICYLIISFIIVFCTILPVSLCYDSTTSIRRTNKVETSSILQRRKHGIRGYESNTTNVFENGKTDVYAYEEIGKNSQNIPIFSTNNETSSASSLCFYCHLLNIEIMRKSDDTLDIDMVGSTLTESRDLKQEEEVHCLRRMKDGSAYKHPLSIELPIEFIQQYSKTIQNGEAHVCIHGGYIQETPVVDPFSMDNRQTKVVKIPNGMSSIEILQSDHPERVLQETNENTKVRENTTSYFYGTRRLLAVRIVTYGYVEEPEESLDQIQGAIFGTGRNPDNIPMNGTVVSQYNAVSQGNLFFSPAILESDATRDLETNGVIEVELPSTIKTFVNASIREYLVPEILKATESSLGRPLDQIADYYIFCIPNHSLLKDDSQWTAFTYLYEPYSYYQESRCTKLSVVMHEMGHGLGFKHSGVGTNEYADKTGYMGYAVNFAGMPNKAFNGHKHWLSGWFRDRTIDLSSWMIEQTAKIRVAAFVDYGKLQLQANDASAPILPFYYHIIIRVNSVLYLQYNFADSYNIHTDPEHANRVTMVEAATPLDESDLKGSLGSGEQYLYDVLHNGVTNTIVIQVCESLEQDAGDTIGLIRYATVVIHYLDKTNTTTIDYCASQNDNNISSWDNSNNSVEQPTQAPLPITIIADEQPTNPPKPYLPEILGDAPTESPTSKTAITEGDDPSLDNRTVSNISQNEKTSKSKTSILIPVLVSSIVFVAILIVITLLYVARQKRDSLKNMEVIIVKNGSKTGKSGTTTKVRPSQAESDVRGMYDVTGTTTRDLSSSSDEYEEDHPELIAANNTTATSRPNEYDTCNIRSLGVGEMIDTSGPSNPHQGNVASSFRIIPYSTEIEAVITASPPPQPPAINIPIQKQNSSAHRRSSSDDKGRIIASTSNTSTQVSKTARRNLSSNVSRISSPTQHQEGSKSPHYATRGNIARSCSPTKRIQAEGPTRCLSDTLHEPGKLYVSVLSDIRRDNNKGGTNVELTSASARSIYDTRVQQSIAFDAKNQSLTEDDVQYGRIQI